jgi:S-adenosylmethionine synthetase
LGDAGLTDRKFIVDGYGGSRPNRGGTFSWKDPSKVDPSARHAAVVAKSIVAVGLADRVLVQVLYDIGLARPLSIYVDTYGTGKIPNIEILTIIEKNFDFSPARIMKALDLRRPIYRQTAADGDL